MNFNSNSNVIDLSARRKTSDEIKENNTTDNSAAVVDMSERRKEIIKEERRTVKRTILTEFLGAFIVIPGQGLSQVSIYDISEKGMSFDMDLEQGSLKHGEEVAMRIYMNQQTYFPFITKINNVREVPEEGLCRHGAGFVEGTINDLALHHFVKFIENVSSCLERDSGDILVSNLRR